LIRPSESRQPGARSSPATSFETHELRPAAARPLGERDQQLLSLYYFEKLTFKEIGKVLGLTESRVCQLHARIILNLKVMVKNEQN